MYGHVIDGVCTWGDFMHIFLTGEIQIGKSTALRRFLQETNISADGFLTELDSRGETRNLYLKRFDTENEVTEQRIAAKIFRNSIDVFFDVFDTFGTGSLAVAGKRRIIIMDELGKFEESCELFKEAVFSRLNGTIPVAGVVRLRGSPFLNAVRAHPKVEVIKVTEKNRDAIPALLTKKLL